MCICTVSFAFLFNSKMNNFLGFPSLWMQSRKHCTCFSHVFSMWSNSFAFSFGKQAISQTPVTSECIQRNIAYIINISFAFFIQAFLVRALQPMNEVKATLQGLAIFYIFDSLLNLLGLFSLWMQSRKHCWCWTIFPLHFLIFGWCYLSVIMLN